MFLKRQTANAFEEDKRASIEAGMDVHLTKPIDVNELHRVMKKYCEKDDNFLENMGGWKYSVNLELLCWSEYFRHITIVKKSIIVERINGKS